MSDRPGPRPADPADHGLHQRETRLAPRVWGALSALTVGAVIWSVIGLFASPAVIVAASKDAPPAAPKPAAKSAPKDAKKAAKKDAGPDLPTAAQREEIKDKTAKLAEAVAALRGRLDLDNTTNRDRFADVAVCLKAGEWIVRHDEWAQKGSPALTIKVLDLGLSRAAALAGGKAPWTSAKGGIGCGYISAVDGSFQPFAVYVPARYDGSKPARLDVVLHGRDGVLTEVKHLASHDGKAAPADQSGLVLHVFGRTNNAFRWAGETDVFEAIAAVKRRWRVDDRRVVLRGFSMGGAGAWHLGLHHPGTWVSVEAGAGFNETIKYARLGDSVPDWVRKGLHIYDAVDWAGNAANLPVAGYGGEDDTQLAAAENIRKALEEAGYAMKVDGFMAHAEGIDFHRLVGPKQGHKVDPASAAWLKDFHDKRAAAGRDDRRDHIRFTTWTLKYNRCGWLAVEAMERHYAKAVVDARIKDDVITVKTEGVAVLSIDRGAGSRVVLDGAEFPLSDAADNLLPEVYYARADGKWALMTYDASRRFQKNERHAKRHGLQGPVDDAFTGPFLCVRGTGTPRNKAVADWADGRLKRFAAEWDKWMRGTLPVKDDKDVTAEDIAGRHLILFGDPGSNTLIAKVLPDLPLTWTEGSLILDGRKGDASRHAPVLISPNPLNRSKYVVINSGHSFGTKDFAGTNALLFPKIGDWALVEFGGPDGGTVAESGYFDEAWQ